MVAPQSPTDPGSGGPCGRKKGVKAEQMQAGAALSRGRGASQAFCTAASELLITWPRREGFKRTVLHVNGQNPFC